MMVNVVSTIVQLYHAGPCRSVLLVGETGVHKEIYRPTASYRQTLSHNFASSTPRLSGIRTYNAYRIVRQRRSLVSWRHCYTITVW